MKHTKAKWWITLSLNKEKVVRSENRFICIFPKPNHYTDQDERYEEEMEEYEANVKLVVVAPELLEALIQLNEGFKSEWGDEDNSDRVCKNIEYWNKLASNAIKKAK